MIKRKPGRRERNACCACHKHPKASNRSYCKRCWAERAAAARARKRKASGGPYAGGVSLPPPDSSNRQ